MTSLHVERIENLNRVMRRVDPTALVMSNWANCVIGHAKRDEYFIKNFNSEFEKSLCNQPIFMLAEYFGIEREQAASLVLPSGYHDLDREPTPSDVVQKLEVILMAKRATAAVEEAREFAEVV